MTFKELTVRFCHEDTLRHQDMSILENLGGRNNETSPEGIHPRSRLGHRQSQYFQSNRLQNDTAEHSYELRERQTRRPTDPFDRSIFNSVFRTNASSPTSSDHTQESIISTRNQSRKRRRKRKQKVIIQTQDDEDNISEDDHSIDEPNTSLKRAVAAQSHALNAPMPAHSRQTRYALRRQEHSEVLEALSRQDVEDNEQDIDDNEQDMEEQTHQHYRLRSRRNSFTYNSPSPTRKRPRKSILSSNESNKIDLTNDDQDDQEDNEDNDDHDDNNGQNDRRYSLRDRSKVRRVDSYTPDLDSQQLQSPNTAYLLRRNRNATQLPKRSLRSNGTKKKHDKHSRIHEFYFPSIQHKKKSRKSHRSRFDSSSSSDSDLYKYNDDSDSSSNSDSSRNMATKGKKGKRRHSSKSLRADISPIQVDGSVTWDQVGGLASHIEALKEMVLLPLLYPEFYTKFQISPPSGVLFHGPPGTGKTLCARALANTCVTASSQKHVTFYMRKGADILSKWVGEAERQLRLLFEEAKKNAPSIIFFDEIDGLAPVRSAKQDQIHTSIVSTLLALMDGVDKRGENVVVIGATNRIDAIDPALRRPGRFDRELRFYLPNEDARKQMLKIYMKAWDDNEDIETLQNELAMQTVGYSGADLKALCAEAAIVALKRVYPQVYTSEAKLQVNLSNVNVKKSDFITAMQSIVASNERSMSRFAKPLPKIMENLLQDTLYQALTFLHKEIPVFPIKYNGKIWDSKQQDASNAWVHDTIDCRICLDRIENVSSCYGCEICKSWFHTNCLSDSSASEIPDDKNLEIICPGCETNESKLVKHIAMPSRSYPMMNISNQIGFTRLLITPSAPQDLQISMHSMGQEYIGAAILHALEGITHISLDYPSLVSDAMNFSIEEVLVRRFKEARKSSPCVLYLPQADKWWANTSTSLHATFEMMLQDLESAIHLPILFLAVVSPSPTSATLPSDFMSLFSSKKTVFSMQYPTKSARSMHFTSLFQQFSKPPKAIGLTQTYFPVLPTAPTVPQLNIENKGTEPSEKQLAREFHWIRELRIFLTQVLAYCFKQKQYGPFQSPVDPMDVPDYYLIIKEPMDLQTMGSKLHDGEYQTFEAFLHDISLIVKNAHIFNPKRSRTRYIAQDAVIMKDNILSFAHRFRQTQGFDLFEKCRAIAKRRETYSQSRKKKKIETEKLSDASVPVRTSLRVQEKLQKQLEVEVIEKEHTEEIIVPQWFMETNGAKKSLNKQKILQESNTGEEGQVQYSEGDHVFVVARTFPGMNQEGGAGIITKVHEDKETYQIKYMLGHSEKRVHQQYIKPLTDEAIQNSFASKREKSVEVEKWVETTEIVEPESELEMKWNYFHRLLWPLLEDNGWKMHEPTDILEKHKETQAQTDMEKLAMYTTFEVPDEQVLTGVEQALQYVLENEDLAMKCFGKRYANDIWNEFESPEVIKQHGDFLKLDNNLVPEDKSNEESQEKIQIVPPKLTVGVVQRQEPKFVYDQERMDAIRDVLVERTEKWTFGDIRHVSIRLNRMFYPYHQKVDRMDFIQQIEGYIASLKSSVIPQYKDIE